MMIVQCIAGCCSGERAECCIHFEDKTLGCGSWRASDVCLKVTVEEQIDIECRIGERVLYVKWMASQE